jgi:hypothetical protein
MKIKAVFATSLAAVLLLAGVVPANAAPSISIQPSLGTKFNTLLGAHFPLKIDTTDAANSGPLRVSVTDEDGGLLSGVRGAQLVLPNGVPLKPEAGAGLQYVVPSGTGTTLAGGLVTSNLHLGVAGSPYKFQKGLEIRSGVKVSVDAGVVLDFSSAGRAFWVHGELDLLGTSANPVIVTVEPGFDLLSFQQAGSAVVRIKHAEIFGSGNLWYGWSGTGSSLQIADTEIYGFTGGDVGSGSLSSVAIEDSVLHQWGSIRLWLQEGDGAQFKFERNYVFPRKHDYAFQVNRVISEKVVIRHNTFVTSGDVLVMADADIDLSNNHWLGLENEGQIKGKILDSEDSLAYSGLVKVSPFLTESFAGLRSPTFPEYVTFPAFSVRPTSAQLMLRSRADLTESFIVEVQAFLDHNENGQADVTETSLDRTVSFQKVLAADIKLDLSEPRFGSNYTYASATFPQNLNLLNVSNNLLSASLAVNGATSGSGWVSSQGENRLFITNYHEPLYSGLVRQDLFAGSSLLASSDTWPVIERYARYITSTGSQFATPGTSYSFRFNFHDDRGEGVEVADGPNSTLSFELEGPGMLNGTPTASDSEGAVNVGLLFGVDDVGYAKVTATYDPDGDGPRPAISASHFIYLEEAALPAKITTFLVRADTPNPDGTAKGIEGAYVFVENSGNFLGAWTDSGGRVHFEDLPVGTYSAAIYGPSEGVRYIPSFFSLVVGSSDQTIVRVLQERPTGDLTISGTVRDVFDEPVVDATVAIWSELGDNYTVQTNSSGEYLFSSLPSGVYWVYTYKSDYYSAAGSQQLNLSESETLNFTLWRYVEGQITGQLVDIDTGAPVSNVFISFTHYDRGDFGWVYAEATSDESGKFSLPMPQGISSAELELDVRGAEGYFPEFSSVSYSGSPITLEISLEPVPVGSNSVFGKVKSREGGQAASEARVFLHYATERRNGDFAWVSKSTLTDGLGNYEFTGLPSSNVMNLEGYLDSPNGDLVGVESRIFSIYSASERRRIDLEYQLPLTGLATIHGKVMDDAGQPVQYISVRIDLVELIDGTAPSVSFSRWGVSDQDGRYSLNGLPTGTYAITAYEDGWDMPNITFGPAEFMQNFITVAGPFDSVEALDIVMPRLLTGTARVRVQFWDQIANAPPTNQTIYLRGDPRTIGSRQAQLDPDGWVEFEGLPAGDYEINLWPSGYLNIEPVNFSVSSGLTRQLSRINLTPTQYGPNDANATVLVRDVNTLNPLANASIRLFAVNSWDQSFGPYTTDANGIVRITGLRSGYYRIYPHSNGITLWPVPNSITRNVHLKSGETRITYAVDEIIMSGEISGVVRDEFGAPVEGVQVSAGFTITFGCCEGDGYAPSAISDASGYYKITGVPTGRVLNFNAQPRGFLQGRSLLTSAASELTISSNSSVVTRDVTLFEQARIAGLTRYQGKSVSGFRVVAIDTSSGLEAGSASSSNWTLNGLSAGSYRLAFRPEPVGDSLPSNIFAAGYFKRTGLETATLVDFEADSTVVATAAGTKLSLPETEIKRGAVVAAAVRFESGDTALTTSSRAAEVLIYKKNSAGTFQRFKALGETYAYGYARPGMRLVGLPEGEYKFEFVDSWGIGGTFDPVFHDGTKSLASAQPVLVMAGDRIEIDEVRIALKAPSSPPTFNFSQVSSSERLLKRDAVATTISTNSIVMNVGDDFTGEYVAVSFDTQVGVNSFRTQATGSTWLLVRDGGFIETPKISSGVISVATSTGTLIGWTQIAAAPVINPPVQSGGGGGGSFTPPAPQSLTKGFVYGKAVQGELVAANVGTWQDQANLRFEYQWHRCNRELTSVDQGDAALNCVPIAGATASTYSVSVADVGRWLLVEITAFDTTGELPGVARVFTNTLFYGNSFGDPVTTKPSPVGGLTGQARGWTRDFGNNQLKLYTREVIGAGKVRFVVNGREIAWVRAIDGTDPKLNVAGDGMVRTVTAVPGRNVFEIYVGNERVVRRVFTRR